MVGAADGLSFDAAAVAIGTAVGEFRGAGAGSIVTTDIVVIDTDLVIPMEGRAAVFGAALLTGGTAAGMRCATLTWLVVVLVVVRGGVAEPERSERNAEAHCPHRAQRGAP
jgi:hypothetical protein